MYADYILSSNAVFDSCSDTFFSGAMAIKGDEIVAISSEKREILKWAGPDTRVLHYEDQLIVPGFGESHAHVIYGALELVCTNLVEAASEEDAARMIYEKEGARPGGWVFAFGWNHLYWREKALPAKKSLDHYFPEQPVVAINEELHSLWVNSKALELCGIDKNTMIPSGNGEIHRDSRGEPTGYLLETPAMRLVLEKAFRLGADDLKPLMENYLQATTALGITSLSNLQIHELLLPEVFKELEEEKRLNVRMSLLPSIYTPLAELLEMKAAYQGEYLKFGGVKGFIDGTPMGHTGFLASEYSDCPGFYGECYLSKDMFGEAAAELEEHNIRMRLHACGDGAVHEALALIQYAKENAPGHDLRHTIEHIEVICPEDMGRLAEMGIVASVQPDHMWSLVFEEHPFHRILGQQRNVYPFKSLLKQGTVLAFGSDHPIAELNPMKGIYRAVTRLAGDGKPEGGWRPMEKLTVAEALKAYTIGSAYLMYNEELTGTLEVGKKADIAVMDRNLFTIEPEGILEARPILTMLGGKVIFQKE